MKSARIWLIILGVSVFVLTTVSCDKLPFLAKKYSPQNPPEPAKIEGTELAKINSKVITLEDFNTRISNLGQMYPEVKFDTFDKKKNLLQTLVQQELLYQHALSLGIDKDPQIKKALEEWAKGLIIQKLISDEAGGANVEAKEIEDYYNLTKDNYRIPAEVKASEIVVADEGTARQVLIEVLKGTDFASLAQQYSKAPSAKNGGNLGWKKRGDRKVERFDEVAFSLKKGEVSNVFSTPEGYFIIKVVDKKGGEFKPVSEVWDQLKQELLGIKLNQRIVELERGLRAKANIAIHEELLR